MSVKLTFQIKLNSDYHISAGHGYGAAIDSALLREADGAPVIRGTTLTGLLRDGLWRLMQLAPMQKNHPRCCKASGLTDKASPDYCGQFDPKAPLCPVCRLIGTPRRPRHWQISSARPIELETIGAMGWKAGQTGSQVAQRARISPRTRRAEPRKLFSQEEGQANLTFTFTINTQANGDGVRDEAALWTAAARMVRQLGRSRRRGQGKCLFELVELESSDADEQQPPLKRDQDELLERFNQKWLNGTPASKSKPAKDTVSITLPAKTGLEPHRLLMIVRADEPVIIAKRAEAGNQFETVPCITGQVVRGTLAWLAAQRFDLSNPDSEIYDQFTKLFMRNRVTFPMLYPAKLSGRGLECFPTIPAPRNWLTCKTVAGLPDSGHGMYGGLHDPPQLCDHSECQASLLPLDGFIALSPVRNLWQDKKFQHIPKQCSELHVRLNPHSGRAKEGDLFSYTALDAGQYFVGELQYATEEDWLLLQEFTGLSEKTPQTLRLGKASQRGYGKITLWIKPMSNDDLLTWIPQALEQRVIDPKKEAEQQGDDPRERPEQQVVNPEEITLTLLTDTIVIDTWGRFVDTFDKGWLSKALGMAVEIIENSVSARTHPVDGFNAYLGLPRWRDIALDAGSAARFKLLDPLPSDWRQKLKQLEFTGIGLRRNEGFGQVAFNHPVYTQCQNVKQSSIMLDPIMKLGGSQPHLATQAAEFEISWQERLDEFEISQQKKAGLPGWRKCNDAQFMAVARWLHTKTGTPPAELANQLTGLGAPDQKLKETITSDEYGSRDKENKLATGKKIGVTLIKKLLIELSEREEDKVNWPLGVKLLAERVADSVDKKGDE